MLSRLGETEQGTQEGIDFLSTSGCESKVFRRYGDAGLGAFKGIPMQTKKTSLISCLIITLMVMSTQQRAWGDWVAHYNGLTAQADNARAVTVDMEGNLYVTGESQGTKRTFAYVTIKYSPDGSEIWANRYEGPGKGSHKPCAIALDSAGNVLVTGSSMALRTRSDLAEI